MLVKRSGGWRIAYRGNRGLRVWLGIVCFRLWVLLMAEEDEVFIDLACYVKSD